MIAVYLLVATTVELGAGPTVVAGANAAPFGDDLAIGRTLAIVTTVAAIAGALLLAWRDAW